MSMRRALLIAVALTLGTALVGCTTVDPEPPDADATYLDIPLKGWRTSEACSDDLEGPKQTITNVSILRVCAPQNFDQPVIRGGSDEGFVGLLEALSESNESMTFFDSCPLVAIPNGAGLVITAETTDGALYHVRLPSGPCGGPSTSIDKALKASNIHVDYPFDVSPNTGS